MSYRWRKCLEAVQLPGELSAADTAGIAVTAKKGDWLAFQDGLYIGCFNDKQWRDQAEAVATPRKKKANLQTAANGETPRRRGPGRKALGRSPLQEVAQPEDKFDA